MDVTLASLMTLASLSDQPCPCDRCSGWKRPIPEDMEPHPLTRAQIVVRHLEIQTEGPHNPETCSECFEVTEVITA